MICVIYDEKDKKKTFKAFARGALTYYPIVDRLFVNTLSGPVRVFHDQAICESNGVLSVIGRDLAEIILSKGKQEVANVDNNQGTGEVETNHRNENTESVSGVAQPIELEVNSVVCNQPDSEKNTTRQGRRSKRGRRNSTNEASIVNDKPSEA